jgi:hypothetical protein
MRRRPAKGPIVAETDIGGVRAADASMNGTTIQE